MSYRKLILAVIAAAAVLNVLVAITIAYIVTDQQPHVLTVGMRQTAASPMNDDGRAWTIHAWNEVNGAFVAIGYFSADWDRRQYPTTMSGWERNYNWLKKIPTWSIATQEPDSAKSDLSKAHVAIRTGWPMHTLQGTFSHSNQSNSNGSGRFLYVLDSANPRTDPPVLIPLGIVPLGFAVNTAFYSVIAFIILGTIDSILRRIRAARDHRRRSASQCPSCGYALGPLSTCPECGHNTVPTEHKTV